MVAEQPQILGPSDNRAERLPHLFKAKSGVVMVRDLLIEKLA